MNEHILPTDSELEILQILWQNGPSTVRFVHDIIAVKKDVGYTSTLKTMQLMLDKGMLERDIQDRTHYYIAALEEQSTQKGLLNEFVASTFRGSASSLMMSVLGDGDINTDELQKIKEMITQLENNSHKS